MKRLKEQAQVIVRLDYQDQRAVEAISAKDESLKRIKILIGGE